MKKVLAITTVSMLICICCFAVSVRKNDAVFMAGDNMSRAENSVYRVCAEGDFIILYEITGEKKEIVKKEPGMPERETDRVELEKGIETESFEDALMIFEDFVS